MITEIEEKKNNLKTNGINTSGKKKLSGDEEWDKIWENPKAFEVLRNLAREAKEQIKNGDYEDGGFGDL
jgi:hypothetical protein